MVTSLFLVDGLLAERGHSKLILSYAGRNGQKKGGGAFSLGMIKIQESIATAQQTKKVFGLQFARFSKLFRECLPCSAELVGSSRGKRKGWMDILLGLGVSSPQLNEAASRFQFYAKSPLIIEKVIRTKGNVLAVGKQRRRKEQEIG